DEDERKALIALYLIFSHHGQLLALDDIAGKIDSDAQRVLKYQLQDIENSIPIIESESGLNQLKELLQFPDAKLVRKQAKIWTRRNQNIADYFLITYLFSLLIEADKLDASETPLYRLKQISDYWVDKRFGAPDLS